MCWLLIYYWQLGKKINLDKSLQIHGKSSKIILKPCMYLSQNIGKKQLYTNDKEQK